MRVMLIGLFYLFFSCIYSVPLQNLLDDEGVFLLEKGIFNNIWILNLSNKNLDDIKNIERVCVKFTENGVPVSIRKVVNLCLLLDNNNLTSLPQQIGCLDLFGLSVAHNKLETLPRLPVTLRSLNVCSNNLQEKECKFLIGLSHLEWLYLANNNLLVIPNCVRYCKNLKVLSLDGNNIKSLDSCILALELLRELSINNNDLADLPAEIQDLSNLTKLCLENNHFKKLPDVLFQMNTGCEVLFGKQKKDDLDIEAKDIIAGDDWSVESDDETCEY